MDRRRRETARDLEAFAAESTLGRSDGATVADEHVADALEMFPSEDASGMVEQATTWLDLPLQQQDDAPPARASSLAKWQWLLIATKRSAIAASMGILAASVVMLFVRPVMMRQTIAPARPLDVPVTRIASAPLAESVSKPAAATTSQGFAPPQAPAGRRSASAAATSRRPMPSAKSTTPSSRQSDNAPQPRQARIGVSASATAPPPPRQARVPVAASPTPEPSRQARVPVAASPTPQPPSQRPLIANAPSAPSVTPAPVDIAVPLPSPATRIPVATDSALPAEAPRVTAAPPPAAPVAAAAPTVGSTPAGVPNPDTRAIAGVLNRYQRAFSALDASAAHAVWPTVDAKALGRAFDQLDQQTIELQGCDITVAGARAEAACGGTARYVRKVGNRTARVEPLKWRFKLRQRGEEWVIDAVDAR